MNPSRRSAAALLAAILTFASFAAVGANTPPTIAGTPSAEATVAIPYLFQPTAFDKETTKLKFTITGKPTWATFSATTGKLAGTPQATHVGTYSNIKISVSDGRYTTALAPFSITVYQPRKSNYGHYFATRSADTPADAAMLCGQPGVRGVVWRRTWGEVEPAAGIYDFGTFDDVLAAIAGSSNPQCQLWLFVEYKSFRSSPIKNPCPAYLQEQYSAPNEGGEGASTCFIWEPVVLQAYVAMMKAAAARYDASPRVEGMIFQESALGFTGTYSQDVAAGGTYTPEAWRDGLVQLVNQCATAFQRSRCVSFLNFIRGGQQYLHDVAAAIAAVPRNRACISGPDILPDEATLYPMYEIIARHAGCRSNSVQNKSYEVEGCDTDCIFRFAVGGTFGDFAETAPRTSGLCVNSYLFWNHRVYLTATGVDWTAALPVIANNPYGAGWFNRCAGGGGVP